MKYNLVAEKNRMYTTEEDLIKANSEDTRQQILASTLGGVSNKRVETLGALAIEREKAKYEMNSSLETLCHVLVVIATKTYENNAIATITISIIWYVISPVNPVLGMKKNGAPITIKIVAYW